MYGLFISMYYSTKMPPTLPSQCTETAIGAHVHTVLKPAEFQGIFKGHLIQLLCNEQGIFNTPNEIRVLRYGNHE